ncbi:hypothetical protein KI387_037412 [Taxus chinensis]|uniref:Uncharacterized protein n=1 Tax=Taxus chinensis TaxID=29808 RepID=A0AA38KWV7_TAXCH|nr:hypothetical protein KI387_037412 [Taxus chinensis]
MAAIFLSPPPHLSPKNHNHNKASIGLIYSYSFAYGIDNDIRHLSRNKRSYKLSLNNAPRFAHSETAVSSSNAGDVWDSFQDMQNDKDYPMVRTFENDLCKLTLVGYRSLEEAITAAAADGGLTAAEHIDSGHSLMVVETICPGHSSERSTVATRLLVPASKVLEKAANSPRTRALNIDSDNSSRNMLAVAFRNVVMQHTWNFELLFLAPGARRDMENLGTSRKVQILGSLTSSDEKVLTGLSEAVCFYAAACMKDDFQKKMLGKNSRNLFRSFKKPKWIASSDSYVRIRPLSRAEITTHTTTWLERASTNLENSTDLRTSRNWWPWPSHLLSMLNSDNEYVPVHKLQIDVGKFKNVKFQGGQKCSGHVWEIFLSHLQLVELADVLDMYYEDPNTCPWKQLQTKIVLEAPEFVMSKATLSLWKALYALLAGGIALVSVIIAARLWKPNILNPGLFPSNSMVLPSPDPTLEGFPAQKLRKPVLPLNEEVSAEEMEAMCILVVEMVKNALQWPGDIHSCAGKGAWTGQNLTEWARSEDKNPTTAVLEDASGPSNKEVEVGQEGLKYADTSKCDTVSQGHIRDNLQEPNADDIAVYEVTLSRNRNLLGFKPKTTSAVNRWASNPLAKVLYGGQKLRPGLLEPRLKLRGPPKDAVIIELLMSDDPLYRVITARPSHI